MFWLYCYFMDELQFVFFFFVLICHWKCAYIQNDGIGQTQIIANYIKSCPSFIDFSSSTFHEFRQFARLTSDRERQRNLSVISVNWQFIVKLHNKIWLMRLLLCWLFAIANDTRWTNIRFHLRTSATKERMLWFVNRATIETWYRSNDFFFASIRIQNKCQTERFKAGIWADYLFDM